MKSHMDNGRPVRGLFEDTQTGVRAPSLFHSRPRQAVFIITPHRLNILGKAPVDSRAWLAGSHGHCAFWDISWRDLGPEVVVDRRIFTAGIGLKQAKMG